MSPTYFPNVTLFDGSAAREGAGVLVSDGTISWVGAHRSAPREALDADTIETAGGTLTPGLIDCHVHLCFDGGPDFVAEARITEPYAAVKCVRNAERHLRAGVTAVRDLGGLGAVACDVARAIEDGRVTGPRVVASGQALTISGGHGWNTFAREVDGVDGIRRAVRKQMRSGARSIKIVATGGVLTPAIPVDFMSFTAEEVDAAVEEAHKWGVPVAAHAIGESGIANCVRAGVDSIEHGSHITADIARAMKEQGTFHVPTISALHGIVEHPEDVPAYAVEKGRQILGAAREAFGLTTEIGVRHACGTDAGTPHNPHGGAPAELIKMVEWGLPAPSALRAATSDAAHLLRLRRVGVIEEGMVADLVLWEGNPLDDIEAVRKPRLVMKSGELFGNELFAKFS
ncbi:MAG TPA: amidohydrolase family protein [Actinomycetota bacterium]|nr:amidohydrolase family protein [Actinomycetota bacterium]